MNFKWFKTSHWQVQHIFLNLVVKKSYLHAAYLKVAYLTALMQCKLRNLCTYGKLNYWYLCSFFLLSSCCHPAHLLQLLASTFSLKKENFKGWRRWGRKRKKKTEKTYSGNYSNLFLQVVFDKIDKLFLQLNRGRRKVHDYFLLQSELYKSSVWFTEKHIFKIVISMFTFLIHQNVPQIMSFHLRYMMVS